jgi:multidrug efflux pump subunit AcrA (membrane-fusion protein)
MHVEDPKPHPSNPVLSSEHLVSPGPEESLHPAPTGRGGRRRFLLPALVTLVLLGGAGWIGFNRILLPMLMAGQPQTMPPTPVKLANPQSTKIQDSSDYAAKLDSRQAVISQPRVAGQISAIYVTAGDRVEAGQPILQIDATEQQAQVNSRKAAVNTAVADVDVAAAEMANTQDMLNALKARRTAKEADVQLSKSEYERFQSLYKEGASSAQVVQQRLNALQTAQASLAEIDAEIRAQASAIAKAKANVVRNQQSVQQSEANMMEGTAQLRYYTIRAPFSGTVGNIPIKVGDFADTTTQLFTIAQNQALQVEIAVPLEKAPDLRKGLTVQLLNDQNQVLQTGRISFIAPNVDPTSQSIQVKAEFDNQGGKLRTEQFVRTRIIWRARPGILVPTTAISRLGGRDFVFVESPAQNAECAASAPAGAPAGAPPPSPEQRIAVQKSIKLGKIIGNNQEVLEGIDVRDRIVVSGILQLQNCMPIMAQTP